MSGNNRPGPNPYVGPQPFSAAQKEYFFGRREEVAVLRDLVMSRRVVLLFAESGAGKSSLLQAGLVPDLTKKESIGHGPRRRSYQKMAVLPIAGVGGRLAAGSPLTGANPYVLSALASLEPGSDPAAFAGQTLAQGLAPHLARDEDETGRPDLATLLIFDQFEEIFTRHEGDRREGARTQREAFFLQVRQALEQHPFLHVLFSMREDYIARLDPYAHLLPDGLRNDYRLERLRRQAALEAVIRPAELAGRRYDEGVAQTLVDDLRRVQIGRLAREEAADFGAEAPLGDFVEPVHLQIVCQQLWDQVPAGETVISAAHLAQLGDVDRALINFYESALAGAVAAGGVTERTLRRWFEYELITPARTRGLVYQDLDKGETAGLPNAAVDVLRDVYIIRSVVRGGEVWFELAHDRLVEPILEGNRQWRASYYNPVAAAFQTWQAGNQDQRLLLADAQLAEAEAFAAANPGELRPAERDFLADSREEQDEHLAAARRRRRNRLLLAAAAILALVLVVGLVLGYQELQRANSRELALSAISSLETDPERGILLAEQAMNAFHTGQAEEALRRALEESRVRRLLFLRQADVDPSAVVLATAEPDFTSSRLSASAPSNESFWDVTYSPDGARLAVPTSSGLVAIWDMPAAAGSDLVASGDLAGQVGRPLVLRVEEPVDEQAGPARLLDIAFSPDGQLMAAAGADGKARLWDAHTGDLLQVLESSPVQMLALAFSPDGRTLYTAGKERLVRTWDVRTGQDDGGAWLVHGDFINDLAISPDGQVLATAGEDGIIKLWALDTRQEATSLDAHEDAVWSVAFSPDGALLASGSQDKNVILWNVTLPNPVAQMAIEAQISAQPRVTLPDPTDTVSAVAFSPEGRCLAAGGVDRTARIWDVETGRLFAQLDGHEDTITGLAFNPQADTPDPVAPAERCGRELATAARDGVVRLWNAGANSSGPVLLQHLEAVESAVYSHAGDLIATAADDAQVILWDAATLRPLRWFEGHSDRVNKVAFSPDDQRLATASGDGTVRLWDVSSARELKVLTAHTSGDSEQPAAIWSVDFSPDGQLLAAGQTDGIVSVWQLLPDGTVKQLAPQLPVDGGGQGGLGQVPFDPPLSGKTGSPALSARFSPDGRWLATASEDGTIKMWDAGKIQAPPLRSEVSEEEAGLIRWQSDHGGTVSDLAFSPGGELLASVSWDNSVKLWRASSGELIATLEGHADRPYGVHFSPDGRYLATSAADGTLRIWDVQSGDNVQTIPGPEFNSLDYSPDGARLVVGGEDGTTRLYDLELEALLRLAGQRLTRALTEAECRRFLHQDACRE